MASTRRRVLDGRYITHGIPTVKVAPNRTVVAERFRIFGRATADNVQAAKNRAIDFYVIDSDDARRLAADLIDWADARDAQDNGRNEK